MKNSSSTDRTRYLAVLSEHHPTRTRLLALLFFLAGIALCAKLI